MIWTNLIGFAVKNWRILSLIIGLVAVGFVIRGEYKRVDQAGYNRAVREYEKAAQMAEEKAQNEVIALQSKYKRLRDGVNTTPDNGIVCPISYSVIERLPEPDSNSGER